MKQNWWTKKQHEWRRAQQIRKQQRLAKKYAKLQAKAQKEQARKRRGPSLSDRYKDWARRRELSKQQNREKWAALQEKHPKLAWLKKHETKFFWLATFVLVSAFAGYVALEAKRSGEFQSAEDKRVLAEVNGVPVYLDTVLDRALFAHGASILQELLQQEIIRQEAERMKVTLTPEDQARVDALIFDHQVEKVRRPQLEASILLGKLVLKDIDEERKRAVYKDFKEDMRTYAVSGLSFADKEAADKFLRSVRKKKLPVEQAALEFAKEGKSPQPLGGFTAAKLNEYFGKAPEKAILKLEPGQYTEPLFAPNNDYLVFRLDGVLTEYEDVEEAVESFIVQIEGPQFLYDLVARADIDSPYVDKDTAQFKDDTPSPLDDEKKKREGQESPSPSPSPSP